MKKDVELGRKPDEAIFSSFGVGSVGLHPTLAQSLFVGDVTT